MGDRGSDLQRWDSIDNLCNKDLAVLNAFCSQADLECTEIQPPTPASQMLGLEVCATTPGHNCPLKELNACESSGHQL